MQGAEHSNAIEQRVLEMAPEHAVLYLPFVVALVEHGVLEMPREFRFHVTVSLSYLGAQMAVFVVSVEFFLCPVFLSTVVMNFNGLR
jgi:hypothetical protein